ncbi:MAG: amidase, partial [Candidatus Dormibacteria bacterium]
LCALASSLDQIGPLSKTVAEAALVMEAIAGPDPRDSTSLDAPGGRLLDSTQRGPRGLRLGVPRQYLELGIDPGVRQVFEHALAALEAEGAERVEVELPTTEQALAAYYVITPAEVSSNLARMDGVRFGPGFGSAKNIREAYSSARHRGFGAEARRRITLGTYALSSGYYDAYYLRAQKVRTLVAQEFAQAFARVDAIVSPTAPTAAFLLGERTADPLAMYATDALTLPANLAGIAGISVPAGFAAGVPVGVQVLGPYLGEAVCFRVAAAIELAAEVWGRIPPLGGMPA